MQFWVFRTRYIVWKLTSLHADSSTKDPVHLSPEIFTKGDLFFSVLASRPHENGVFVQIGHFF